MVERYSALIREEDFPLIKDDGVFRRAGLREKRLRESLRKRASRHGDLEGIMAVDTCGLALDQVRSEGCSKRIDIRKGEEVGLFRHRDSEFWWDVWRGEECGWCYRKEFTGPEDG